MKGKNKKMWAVTNGGDGKPQFHRVGNGPCSTCGLKECLPDQPHGSGQFYHADLCRFVSLDEVAVRGSNGDRLEPRLPEGFRSVKAYERELEQKREEQKRKTRERVRRYRQRKRLEKSEM